MDKYIITSDSTTDIGAETMRALNVPFVRMRYILDGKEYLDAMDDSVAIEIYEGMKNGLVYSTSQPTSEDFETLWIPILESGLDILHVCFSSGQSGTINCATMVAKELEEKFPERRIIVVDSLCSSAGEGLLLEYVVDKKNSGADIDTCYNYLMDMRLKVEHRFTVGELLYLKRGGRISSTAAFFGDVLQIKPLLDLDLEGRIIPRRKVKGRKNALKAIAEEIFATIDIEQTKYIRIGHAHCPEDAEYMVKLLHERLPDMPVRISYIGSVIGTHCGPGTLAMFYIGNGRHQ